MSQVASRTWTGTHHIDTLYLHLYPINQCKQGLNKQVASVTLLFVKDILFPQRSPCLFVDGSWLL